MREMSTDRPDKTASPYTIDAGHFQIELDVVSYTYDQRNPERTKTRVDQWDIMPMNLKVGLLNNADLHVLLDTHMVETTSISTLSTHERRSGFGDLTLRLKMNL